MSGRSNDSADARLMLAIRVASAVVEREVARLGAWAAADLQRTGDMTQSALQRKVAFAERAIPAIETFELAAARYNADPRVETAETCVVHTLAFAALVAELCGPPPADVEQLVNQLASSRAEGSARALH